MISGAETFYVSVLFFLDDDVQTAVGGAGTNCHTSIRFDVKNSVQQMCLPFTVFFPPVNYVFCTVSLKTIQKAV